VEEIMKQLGLGIIVAIPLTLPVFGQSIVLEKTYYITPLENDATRVVRLRAFIFPPKADSGFSPASGRGPERPLLGPFKSSSGTLGILDGQHEARFT
jgi:hypothetical protein